LALIERGQGRRARLLLLAHHLLIDGVSWRILLSDLHSLYQQLASSQPAQLPPKTTSYQQWAEQLRAYAQTERCLAELPYWRTLASQAQPLPRDWNLAPGANTSATERVVRESFSQ